MVNWWPPFLAAGIRVTRLDNEGRATDVELRMHWWNANYVCTHYGGSLYSMTDPFYMMMLMENLGREYIVWDKSACVRFRRASKERVTAEFRVGEPQLEEIRQALEEHEKYEPSFKVEVRDATGQIVAEVEKVLYVRRKSPRNQK
jgi:hypothetical protein